MHSSRVKVEYLYAGGCSRCAEAREGLKSAAQSAGDVEWEEVDIGKHPVRAVDLGVVATPAVALDGVLVFNTAPTAQQLIDAVKSRLAKA